MALYTNVIKKHKTNNSVIKKYNIENFESIEPIVEDNASIENKSLPSLKDIYVQEEKIISSAREQAELIKNEAKAKGYEDGFQEGSELGYEAGFKKSMEDVQAQKNIATELLLQAERERKETLTNLEDEIIHMIMDIAEKVARISIEDNYEKILPMIDHALNHMVDREKVVIRANSQNIEILKNNEKQLKQICSNAIFTFLKDNTLNVTECVIDSEIETIDLDIQSQISNILKAFAKVR